jgi:putative NADPH-quinone reductase
MTHALSRSQLFRFQSTLHEKEVNDLRELNRELTLALEESHHKSRYLKALVEAQHNQILTLRSQLDVNA